MGYSVGKPVWSPDGSKFILMGDDEFYVVSLNGIVTKLTHMNPTFVQSDLFGEYSGYYYQWSPDGEKVAFWLEGKGGTTLAILDTKSGKIVDTCILAGHDTSWLGVVTPPYSESHPVWSPDGKNLVVAANFRREGGKNDILLVDPDNNVANKITTDKFPVGWLVTP
jgi:Tol biopolymer transport system component